MELLRPKDKSFWLRLQQSTRSSILRGRSTSGGALSWTQPSVPRRARLHCLQGRVPGGCTTDDSSAWPGRTCQLGRIKELNVSNMARRTAVERDAVDGQILATTHQDHWPTIDRTCFVVSQNRCPTYFPGSLTFSPYMFHCCIPILGVLGKLSIPQCNCSSSC